MEGSNLIKVENVHVDNIVRAVYSARNAMNSWDKSDSDWESDTLGTNDLQLAKKLAKAGSDHAKYLRTIIVTVDITAPLYWWKQFDQYKVGVTTNSCSTMHKIHAKEFTLDDFSVEHLDGWSLEHFIDTLNLLNKYRYDFIETKNKSDWWQMIQLLPSSYNQKRTITMNYENAVNMIRQRENHKLDEWRDFVKGLQQLPYIKKITEGDGNC